VQISEIIKAKTVAKERSVSPNKAKNVFLADREDLPPNELDRRGSENFQNYNYNNRSQTIKHVLEVNQPEQNLKKVSTKVEEKRLKLQHSSRPKQDQLKKKKKDPQLKFIG